MKISRKRLNESYKLRFYKKQEGPNQGDLDHEEFFDTRLEAINRYEEVFDRNAYSLNPTMWVGDGDNWKRLSEVEINESLNESDRPDGAPIDFWEPSGEDADEYYQINILTDMFDADPSRFEQALEDFGYNPTNYDNFDSFLKDVDKVDILNKFADLLQKNDELNSSWYDHFDFTEAPLPFDFDESLNEDLLYANNIDKEILDGAGDKNIRPITTGTREKCSISAINNLKALLSKGKSASLCLGQMKLKDEAPNPNSWISHVWVKSENGDILETNVHNIDFNSREHYCVKEIKFDPKDFENIGYFYNKLESELGGKKNESLKEDFEDYEDRLFYRKSDRLENSVEKRFPGWKIFVEGSWQSGIGSDFIYIYPPDDIKLEDDPLRIYLNGSFLDISNREILKLIAQEIKPVIQANESLNESSKSNASLTFKNNSGALELYAYNYVDPDLSDEEAIEYKERPYWKNWYKTRSEAVEDYKIIDSICNKYNVRIWPHDNHTFNNKNEVEIVGPSKNIIKKALNELRRRYDFEMIDESLKEAFSDDLKKVNLNKFNVGTLPYQVLQFLWDLSENGKLDDRSLERQANNILELINRNISNESFNEALSDEAKANNEMIQKILNKKPSQLTAKEKKFLADNDLVRYSSTGGQYTPNIRKNGAPWYNSINKGDRLVTNRSSNPKNRSAYNSLNDVDQLNLLKKRDERSRARIEADKDPDILAPQNYQGIQGPSKLQDFNKDYEKDIKGSKRYAKNARDFMNSYIETGSRLKADLAKHSADISRVLKDQAKKSLEHRPKFESLLDKSIELAARKDVTDYFQKMLYDQLLENPPQAQELDTEIDSYDADWCPQEFDSMSERKFNKVNSLIDQLSIALSDTYFDDSLLESLKEDDAVDDDNFLTEGFLHLVKE